MNRSPPGRRYALVLSTSQANIVLAALDLYSRIGTGQLAELGNIIRDWHIRRGPVDAGRQFYQEMLYEPLRMIQTIVFRLRPDEHYATHDHVVPAECRTAYDVQQVLRYAVALDEGAEALARGERVVTTSVALSPYRAANPDVPAAACTSLDALLLEARMLAEDRAVIDEKYRALYDSVQGAWQPDLQAMVDRRQALAREAEVVLARLVQALGAQGGAA